MIDGYLTDLDRRLRGSGRRKADLLAEARDGLHDAADAYRAGGWSDEAAERRAVADFGPVAVVARGYQAELGVTGGVQVLWQLVLGVPLLQLSWDYARILTFGAWTNLPSSTPEWYRIAARGAHGTVFLVPVLALLALAGTRWLSRRFDGARLARCCVLLVVPAVGVNVVSVGLLVGATGVVDVSRLFLSVPCAVLMGVWVLLSVRLVVLARRSWGGCATIVA